MDVKKLREFAANCLRVAKITTDPELATQLRATAQDSLGKAEKIASAQQQQQQQQQIQANKESPS